MAYEISTSNIHGLFNVNGINMTTVTESAATAEFTASVKNGKDPIFVIVDMGSAAGINISINLISADGKKVTSIGLSGQAINIIPITSYGIADEKGVISFNLTRNGGNILPDMNVQVGVFTHSAVVNN